ncbi:recombinase family protein [Yokenella regensburgei]|uniref:recombinase family protein n=1 Tax=Yokenella regensburgei TaxID=158877 RepID=UPI001ED91280|nr:recombinase family protein [Yokenella regensburgei]KAF1366232.1 DNA invertase Pin-like site-specific DNA recombinase [Yokenella regensburgei]
MATENRNHAYRLRAGLNSGTAQIAALESAGCELIFEEKASGGRWNWPDLQRLLQQLRKGDQVIVWKLDRLSRSLKDILVTQERIENAGGDFCNSAFKTFS